MSGIHTFSVSAAQASASLSTGHSRLHAFIDSWRTDANGRRAHRIVTMVLFLWAINIVDLDLTMLAVRMGGFEEANPIAQSFMGSSVAMIVYKFLLVIPATGIMLLLRRRFVTELGCWAACAAYVCLAMVWVLYFRNM